MAGAIDRFYDPEQWSMGGRNLAEQAEDDNFVVKSVGSDPLGRKEFVVRDRYRVYKNYLFFILWILTMLSSWVR
ncbi:hypothetical protein CH063_10293 [Colletotrichum higginsianum]|uniref:Uncharacterized protein n=1 Tax=Colletotrichum higginsianum (strain IMI 349063) TaxID=759273 RepID=H1VGW5_COLHI|nr:hypothetical protein CH063_10293 [Colletotrichum higginsianum]